MTFPFFQLVFGSIALLISLYTERYKDLDLNKWLEEQLKIPGALPQVQEFDFIIIGAGSAGCVVANRLSEKYNVLVIESGGNPIPQTDVPGFWPYLYTNENVSQLWTTVPLKHSGLSRNGRVTISQGKGMGGSSTINAMLYNRGSPHDYDNWANYTGDNSWSYSNILKYFKKSENYLGAGNGNSGPMFISNGSELLNEKENYWLNQWKKAGEEIGFKSRENSNTPQEPGFAGFTVTKRNGRRVSTWNSFIQPIENRENLKIHKYSVAEKVIFDDNHRALGVLYKRHGVYQYAKARKEIVLSAGTLNSPHILMNSGIGQKSQLDQSRIPLIVDSPVGQNFQDHPAFVFNVIQPLNEPYPNPDDKEIENFIQNGKGPLANVVQLFGQAFIVSNEAKKENNKEWPDIQFCTGFKSESIMQGGNKWFIDVILSRPRSYGKVTLDKSDPLKPLQVDPNYLSDERDIKAVIEGLQIAQKIAESKAVQEVGIKLDKIPIDECKEHSFGTQKYWNCWARQVTTTVWHPVGTCRMGKIDDKTSVVDSNLKVKGVSNLRVIDNSIQPVIINANTNAPAILIGQKGADMMLNEWISKS